MHPCHSSQHPEGVRGIGSVMSNTHKRIRFVNSDGPLVPMVRLVPIEKNVIPMVLLVNMHLIKGTSIIFSIPMVHWYQ